MPSHVLRTQAFTPAVCKANLETMRKSVQMQPGGTQGDNSVRRDIRRSSVGWPDPRHHGFIREVDRTVREINDEAWGLELNEGGEYQLTHYDAATEGAYHTHIDVDMSGGSAGGRKVSFVLQLSKPSDYAGGDLRLEHVTSPDAGQLRRVGSLLVFPSFIPHSVAPLIRGERWSLVAWLSGPPLV